MRTSILLLASALCFSAQVSAQNAKPIRVILVGDSTMAPRSGYGDALCERFVASVTCLNLAKGGRSSGSFRAEGLWDQMTGWLRDSSTYSQTYVLIQFGHNDQPGKPGRSTDLVTGFTPNMARYAQEVKALGAVPVLMTPLTRRSFKDGVLQNDLRAWAEVTLRTAVNEKVPVLDLNADSYAAVQAMGEAEADTLAMAPPPSKEELVAAANTAERAGAAKTAFDRTHVGAKGAAYFADMVKRELSATVPAIIPFFKSSP